MAAEAQFVTTPALLSVRPNGFSPDEPLRERLFVVELGSSGLPYTGTYLRLTLRFGDLMRLQAAISDAVDQAVRANPKRVEVPS